MTIEIPSDFPASIPETRARHGERFYTREIKLNAAACYVATGSMYKVAQSIGVRKSVVQSWRNSEWWPHAVECVRAQISDETKAAWRAIVIQAQGEVLDRLQNGEIVMRGGHVYRVPVRAKDAAVIMGIAFDKLMRLNPRLFSS